MNTNEKGCLIGLLLLVITGFFKFILVVCGATCTILGGLVLILIFMNAFSEVTLIQLFLYIVTSIIVMCLGIVLLHVVFRKGRRK